MRSMGKVLVLVMALVATVARGGVCDEVVRLPTDYERSERALLDELALSPPDRLDFQVGGQAVFLHASTVTREYEDLLRDVLENIAGELASLADVLGSREARPVHVIATLQEDIFPGPFAFASCHRGDEPWAHYADGSVVPGTACLVVVFPDRIAEHGADTAAFVMAHEWMHTLQSGVASERPHAQTRWWAEGSAEWFAHKVVEGYDGRAHRIAQFHEMQPRCTLQDITYPSQVFFFWGEQAFDARWVMELALGEGEHLSSPSAIAGIMAPEHWRAWSIALADNTIRYPDGRPLPTPPEPDTLRLRPQCPLRIQGPPLSVQMRRVELAAAARGGRLHFDTGDAVVSLRWPDGRWQHLKQAQESVDPGVWDHVTVAAISVGEHPANVRIGAGGLGDDCACHIGDWIEVPGEGGRSFRAQPEGNPGLAAAGFDMEISFEHDGPVLSLGPDHTYTLDDPYQQRFLAAGDVFWQLSLDHFSDSGRWRIDDERSWLVLTRTARHEQGSLLAAGEVSPWSSHRELPGRDIAHEFVCSGDRLELSGPGRAAATAAGVADPPPAAVFRRAGSVGDPGP